MCQPIGLVNPDYHNCVCRLHKALYSLKQVPCAWFSKLSTRLSELGFVASVADPSIFIYHHNSVTIYILVYIDDIILTESCSKSIYFDLNYLRLSFPLKDLGPLRYFLGLEINLVSWSAFIPNQIHL